MPAAGPHARGHGQARREVSPDARQDRAWHCGWRCAPLLRSSRGHAAGEPTFTTAWWSLELNCLSSNLLLCLGRDACFNIVLDVLQDLQQQVDLLKRGPNGQQLATLQNENAELRLELDMKHRQLEAAGGVAPQQVAARPLVAADLPALDAGMWFAWQRPPFFSLYTVRDRVRAKASIRA